MSAEDELQKLIASQAAAAEQLQSEIGKVAETLAALRTQLIVRGFTTDGAEDLVLEWFVQLLQGSSGDDDDD